MKIGYILVLFIISYRHIHTGVYNTEYHNATVASASVDWSVCHIVPRQLYILQIDRTYFTNCVHQCPECFLL